MMGGAAANAVIEDIEDAAGTGGPEASGFLGGLVSRIEAIGDGLAAGATATATAATAAATATATAAEGAAYDAALAGLPGYGSLYTYRRDSDTGALGVTVTGRGWALVAVIGLAGLAWGLAR